MPHLRFGLRASLAAIAVLVCSASLGAYQAAPATQAGAAPEAGTATDATQQRALRVSYEAPVELQHTDLPQWPYTPSPAKGAPQPPPDNGEVHHLPGSTAAFTQKEIDGLGAVDWFPNLHPKAPASVTEGKAGQYRACGTCHLINGYGKSDTENLNGISLPYAMQQLEDMKGDVRHAAVVNMGVISMIPVAKGVPDADAKEALEYFHSIGPAKWVRVVETDMVIKTSPGPHRLTWPDPSGAKEPIGNRVIEVPESFERTELRDPTSGFVAYVPVGSIKKGEAIVKTGAGGKTLPCATCHGVDLKGGFSEVIPSLAGRSPSAMGRQLYDFKTGARHGKNSVMMQPVVSKLTDEDIVNIVAYLSSLPQ
jgi:cytochrome c553